MSSLSVIDALEKRGYIDTDARQRLLEKRAAVVVDHIAEKTAGVFSRMGHQLSGVGDASAALARRGVAGHKVQMGWPEWIGNVARVLGVGAGLAAGGAAVGAAGHAVEKAGLNKRIKSSRTEVANLLAEQNPEIKRQQDEVFDAVARYAPTLAADPLVAAGIVRGIARGTGGMSRNLPNVDTNFVRNLAEAESKVHESRSNTRFGKMHEKMTPGLTNQFAFGDKG